MARAGRPSTLDAVAHESDRFGPWARAHPAALDTLLAGIVLATFEMPAFDPYRHDGRTWWAFWGVAIALPLLWRRRAPLTVLAVTLAGTVGSILTRSGPNWGVLSQVMALLGPALALGTVALSTTTRRSQAAALVTAVAAMGATQAARSGAPDVFVSQALALAGSWLVGEVVRARRSELILLHGRVADEAAQAASEERNRIARELHDIVAHQLSVMAIQAGAARLAGDGHDVTPNLVAIEEAARQALTDLRGALGVLRAGSASGVAPQPRLEELDRLARRLREAGLPLEMTTTGDLAMVPGGVSVTSFRIVQEALTNVVNHAGAVPTRVRVARTLSGVELEVCNDASARRPPVTVTLGGQGLIGMRERVVAYRGQLEAGPLPSGGFAVRARIPLP
jgi:signal transduction histidine kinase